MSAIPQSKIINKQMLISASLAQISVSNWSSLDNESKLNLADLIFENLPKNYLFKLAMKICNAKARDVEVDSFVAELVENEDENQIILEFRGEKKQVKEEVGVEEKIGEPLPLSPSNASDEEEIEEEEEVPNASNSFEDLLNQLLNQSAPQNPIQPQHQQQNPPPPHPTTPSKTPKNQNPRL